MITANHTPVGAEKLMLTGAELAHVLSLRAAYNNLHHMAERGDVNLRLRGLSELLLGHVSTSQLGENGAYFLASALDDLAARLEASNHVEQFTVFVRKGVARTEAS